jgi:DNA polymerase III epsilon subunit-like protein
MGRQPLDKRAQAFIDIETTGLDENDHEIIEVACARRFRVSEEWREDVLVTKLKPLHLERAQDQAMGLNGYTEEGWKDAPHPAKAIVTIRDFLKGAVIIGQNVQFDMRFVRATLTREHGSDALEGLPYHLVDTATLTYEHLPWIQSMSLHYVCEALGISNEGEHGALIDARRCMAVYDKLIRATEEDRQRWAKANT